MAPARLAQSQRDRKRSRGDVDSRKGRVDVLYGVGCGLGDEGSKGKGKMGIFWGEAEQ